MNNFTLKLAAASFLLCGSVISYASTVGHHDISKFAYKGKGSSNIFDSERLRQIQKANALLDAGKPSRFAAALTDNATDESVPVEPSQSFPKSDLHGDMDGPDGKLWFYSGKIEYDSIYYNEYFTDYVPTSVELTVYNSEMKVMGTIADKFELKEDESRVRSVSVLPVITRNYFNSDDKYEVVISVIVNPEPYGIRPYTYVYSLDAPKDADGHDVPVMVMERMVSDVCDASDSNGENIVMTFVMEGNDSDVTEEDFEERFWEYQLGNFIKVESYGKAGVDGKLVKVFDKKICYYQTQGNQEDDATMMTYVHNGRPAIIFPYYENVFYNEFGISTDMEQRFPNNLIIEIYELDDLASGFTLKQTTKIPMSKAEAEDVIASYYGVGSFSYTDDVVYAADGAVSFIVTRRDYIASSDSERMSYFIYNSDGTPRQVLFDGAVSHTRLSNLDGFAPMELFITMDEQGDYVFNFTNMTTLETELKLNYGLKTEDSDEPDYMMANISRTKVGDSFMYVAEMRSPEYDEFNDTNYMRVVWLTRDGKIDHMEYLNMGNKVNYAALFLDNITLNPDYFHEGPEHEYMMLIKRAFEETSTKTEEQLLVAQATSESYPQGRELLLLGKHDLYGNLVSIIPYTEPNRLSVTYGNTEDKLVSYTTVYYDLPFNKGAGVTQVSAAGKSFAFDGTTVSLQGAQIEVFNLQGIKIASGRDEVELTGIVPGVYFVTAAGETGKIVVR